jgi:hypothetical protein
MRSTTGIQSGDRCRTRLDRHVRGFLGSSQCAASAVVPHPPIPATHLQQPEPVIPDPTPVTLGG